MKEHQACREGASLFDVSHMLQTSLKGKDSVDYLEKICCGDIKELKNGQSLYTLLLNTKGTIVDDAIVQKIDENDFYLVSNAGCRDKVKPYLKDMKTELQVDIEEIDKSLIAIQGPKAVGLFEQLVKQSFKELYFMNGKTIQYNNTEIRVSRCGYTGEDGLELSVDHTLVEELATDLVKLGIEPSGLGCRDSLRLESGLCLYGNDIDENTSILEASLLFAVGKRRRNEGGFNGFDIYKQQKENGVDKKRVGIVVDGAPSRAHALLYKGDNCIGQVTSGCPSPTLKKNIAMAYVPPTMKDGVVKIRNKMYNFTVEKMPFVKQNYYRK